MGESVTFMGCLDILKKQELKKHVAMIHCANTISLLQRKISNALLCFAYLNLMTIEEHSIGIKQLCNLIGYSGNNHQVIKDSLKSLMSTVLEWNIVDTITGQEDWTASTMLASANIKDGKCRYAYSLRMRELLYSPAMYGKIDLAVQARFKSSYGLALYENCVRYKGLPYTRWFDLDVFRKLMGVPKETYSVFRDLKKRILDKAVSEVNLYSDLYVEHEINREGKKVVAIRFKLDQKEKKKAFFMPSNSESRGGEGEDELSIQQNPYPLFQKLKKLGLLGKQIDKILLQYAPDYIESKIAYLESSKSFKSGKIEDIASYLISALQNDYQLSKASADILNEVNGQKIIEEESKKISEKKEENLKFKYEQYRAVEKDRAIDRLDTETVENLKEDFKKSLLQKKDTLILPRYCKNELESNMVRAYFRNFIEEQYPSLLPKLLSFKEFSANSNIIERKSTECDVESSS